jgi:hypothetical protein
MYTKEEQLKNNKPKKISTFGTRKKAKIKKHDTVDDDYSKWLSTKPCVVTGKISNRGIGLDNIHCHHIYGRTPVRNDHLQVPLLGRIHSWGDKAYHNNTKEDFIIKNDLPTNDIIEYFKGIAEEYYREYLSS